MSSRSYGFIVGVGAVVAAAPADCVTEGSGSGVSGGCVSATSVSSKAAELSKNMPYARSPAQTSPAINATISTYLTTCSGT